MNTIKIFIAVMFYYSAITFAQTTQIFGEALPGSILIGKAENAKSIHLNKTELRFDGNGYFIFGFDRDAKGTHLLKIRYKNKKSETIKLVLPKRKYDVQRLRVKSKYVAPPKSERIRIKNETAELKQARENFIQTDSAFYSAGFIMPVDSVRITSEFGSQRILNGVRKKPHNGIDFGGDLGSNVYAITDGIVVFAAENFYYNGSFVLLNHGQNLTSIYLHLNSINVKTGDKVLKGQKIGELGSTGRSTGPHLHLGVQWRTKRIDPQILLNLQMEKENEGS